MLVRRNGGRRPLAALAAGALALSLLLGGGCGGGESSTSGATGEPAFTVEAITTVTTGSTPMKAVFLARVNRICRRNWSEILENFAEYSSWQGKGLSEQQLFAKSVRDSYLAGVDFLIFDPIFRLGAPKGEEREVEDVIGAMQIAVEKGQRVVSVPTTKKLEDLFADYNQAAREYGLVDCLVQAGHLPELPLAPPAPSGSH
jgi:hypothetical protein